MSLFAGPDVNVRPGWLNSRWVLAGIAAALPVDIAVALITGMPRLDDVLEMTALPVPAATRAVIALAATLATWWPLILPLFAGAPFLVAWRLGDRGVPLLKAWVATVAMVFVVICVLILLPFGTIVNAIGAGP